MTPSQAVQEYLKKATKILRKYEGVEYPKNLKLSISPFSIELAKMIQLQAHWQKEEGK